jgi:hypothetical protein
MKKGNVPMKNGDLMVYINGYSHGYNQNIMDII